MDINWEQIKNPILDFEPKRSLRDPALYFDGKKFYLFHSAVEYSRWKKIQFYLDLSTSTDLIHWTPPKRIFNSNAGFSSPGNILKIKDKWVLCFQTYPIPRFQQYANNNCRLWISESHDLENWTTPKIISPKGCQTYWASNPRQIDPFIFQTENEFYCYYKAQGSLGVLKSTNLVDWKEIHIDTPIFSRKDTPDNTNIENIYIIEENNQFYMFFSPCYSQRGIGVAISSNLIDWKFLQYLEFPKLSWAYSGPSAPSIIDLRGTTEKYVMAFHGDRERPHHAVLGLAWSKDLLHWNTH